MMSTKGVATLNIRSGDHCCIIHIMSKIEVVNLLQNQVKEGGTL